MKPDASRRGFLRGLTTLPLIGGSVALVGSPTAAAVPVTGGTIATYLAWLHFEYRYVRWAVSSQGFVPMMNPGAGFHSQVGDVHVAARRSVELAPVVLATVGCPLTSAEAEAEGASYGFDRWREIGPCA